MLKTLTSAKEDDAQQHFLVPPSLYLVAYVAAKNRGARPHGLLRRLPQDRIDQAKESHLLTLSDKLLGDFEDYPTAIRVTDQKIWSTRLHSPDFDDAARRRRLNGTENAMCII
jgi:hypothetical protein